MVTLAREDDVVFADHRLVARLGAIREDWRNLKSSSVDTLTKPALLFGVGVAAAAWGARKPSPPKPTVCVCANAKVAPLFSRTILLAVVGPLVSDAIARGLSYLSGETASAPDVEVSEDPGGASYATPDK